MLISSIVPVEIDGSRILRWINEEEDVSSPKGTNVEHVLLDLGGKVALIQEFVYCNPLPCHIDIWNEDHGTCSKTSQ